MRNVERVHWASGQQVKCNVGAGFAVGFAAAEDSGCPVPHRKLRSREGAGPRGRCPSESISGERTRCNGGWRRGRLNWQDRDKRESTILRKEQTCTFKACKPLYRRVRWYVSVEASDSGSPSGDHARPTAPDADLCYPCSFVAAGLAQCDDLDGRRAIVARYQVANARTGDN